MPVIGFIGTGNMGGALARAAAKQAGNRVLLTNRTQSKAEALAAQIGAEAADQAGGTGAPEAADGKDSADEAAGGPDLLVRDGE